MTYIDLELFKKTKEFQQLDENLQSGIASLALEGIQLSETALADLIQVSKGEMMMDDAIKRAIKKAIKKAKE